MSKMDAWTFLSQLSSLSYYAFYIVPDCIRNHHTEFEIGKTIIYDIPKLVNQKIK